MKHAVVVGSGVAGATVAKELQGKFQVTVVEQGSDFRPLDWGMRKLEILRTSRLLFDERLINLFSRSIRASKTKELVVTSGRCLGGSSVFSTGSGLRLDMGLRELGIDLEAEFGEVYQEIPVGPVPKERWSELTRTLFDICQDLGLNPMPMPKMGDYGRCRNCGRCVFGCTEGAKWDSRRFLAVAQEKGARLLTGRRAEQISADDQKARGLWVRSGGRREFITADAIVLAGGGLETPTLLQQSGIPREYRLFVEPVLCLAAGIKDSRQCQEIPAPFYVQREHLIIAPYFDHLSYLFNRSWRFSKSDTVSLMIQFADSPAGSVRRGEIHKSLLAEDWNRLDQGINLGFEILARMGADRAHIAFGTMHARQPGGMLPLRTEEVETLHHERLPDNTYVADSSLLPRSLGGPSMPTLIALAKKVSRACIERWA